MTGKFFANKKTKVLHANRRNDSCRAGEILPENRVKFTDTEVARKEGYRTCKRCVWETE